MVTGPVIELDRPEDGPGGGPPGQAAGPVRSSARQGRRRRWRVLLVVLAVVVVAYGTVTVVFFVRPGLGTVRDPQAVVVLDGYGDRVARGAAIARADHVDTLVVSAPPWTACPREGPPLRVLCFSPDPASTRGEARAVGSLARRHGWSRLVVVAGTTQVTRARIRLQRCYAGQMAFQGVDPSGLFGWVHFIAYDEVAIVKALVWQRAC